MTNFKKSLIKLIFLSLLTSVGYAQESYKAATVGFYNLENLFDTIQSSGYIDGTKDYQDEYYHITISVEDTAKYEHENLKTRLTENALKDKKVIRKLILIDEFTPQGGKAFDGKKYQRKLKNLSEVISDLGRDVTHEPPVVVGVVEVETRKVVEDLISQPALKDYPYKVVHYNSLDKRGIDCALIYRADRFVATETRKYELEVFNTNGNRDYTRDIVRVSGLLDGEPMHFLVNHWPSRRGGEAASAPKRRAAAKLLKDIVEEIQAEDEDAKIIMMGDFNDDPISPSLAKELKAHGKKKFTDKKGLYNAMYPMYNKGFGTLAYRDGWNLFDQMIFTKSLIRDDFDTYREFRTEIYSPSYLISKEGQYKGYPNRMYGGDTYKANGYSDHFPVYTILLKKVQ